MDSFLKTINMTNKILLSIILLSLSFPFYGQDYQFKIINNIENSTVKNQGQTGTCWSFATSSFLESEIYRINGIHVDVSEMFIVRNTYDQKAWNYLMRQGKSQFSEGGLAHDVINAVADYGIAPQSAFLDIYGKNSTYNHTVVIPKVKEILDAYIKNGKDSKHPNWKNDVALILDKEIGKKTIKFMKNGVKYNPISYRKFLKIIPDDYISITSFTHEDYYTKFVLNIPDNFSNGSFYNVPLDDLVNITKNALQQGFTISLDVDVSEKTFITKTGVATLPIKNSKTSIPEEIEVTDQLRQQEFENFNTTDDHLMHITGIVEDAKGTTYFKVKNSWGGNSQRVGNNGYIYMSVPYFKMKAISILLHKDALSKKMKQKIKL